MGHMTLFGINTIKFNNFFKKGNENISGIFIILYDISVLSISYFCVSVVIQNLKYFFMLFSSKMFQIKENFSII